MPVQTHGNLAKSVVQIRAGDRVGQLGIFPGAHSPGGPMGAHSKGNFFFQFQRKEKIENF